MREGDIVELNSNMIVTCEQRLDCIHNEGKPYLQEICTHNGYKPCLENDQCNDFVGYKTISADNKLNTETFTDAEIKDSHEENNAKYF